MQFVPNCEQGLMHGGCDSVKSQSLTPVCDVVRYRLRRSDRVVGWMREESSGARFYSREGLWWSGRPIQWEYRDRCCGLQDLDNRWLHEGDLLVEVGAPWWSRRRPWLILCDEKSGWTWVRRGLIQGMVTMHPHDIVQRSWRWAGVGWRG